jgi:hypothetical protein
MPSVSAVSRKVFIVLSWGGAGWMKTPMGRKYLCT